MHSSTLMTLNVVDSHRISRGTCNNVYTCVRTSKHGVDRGCVRVMAAWGVCRQLNTRKHKSNFNQYWSYITSRRNTNTCVFEKSWVKRKFSCLRASRVATTAPIALVREYIFKLFTRFPTPSRSSSAVQYRVAGGVRDFVHLQRKFFQK